MKKHNIQSFTYLFKNKRYDHPSAAWLTRVLLVTAFAIAGVFVFFFLTHDAAGQASLFDSLLSNFAATSALFILSVTVLQNAIKELAREELTSLISDVLNNELFPSLSPFISPITGDNRSEAPIRVTKNFGLISKSFTEQLKSSSGRDSVKILNTWIPQLIDTTGNDRQEFIDALLTAWRGGANIKILMVFPYSTSARLRAESVRQGNSSYNEALVDVFVEQCLSELNEISKDIDENLSGQFEIRLFSTLPSVSLYWAKNTIVVGTFLHAKRAVEGPQLVIADFSKDHFLSKTYTDEFDRIWHSSSEHQFKLQYKGEPIDIRRELDILRGHYFR
jgi:hypothetical protein